MNLNNKHIVFLTPGFAQNEQDTTTIPALQEYIFALKNEIPELKITIITFQFPFTKEKYNWNNCAVIPFGGKNQKLKKIQIWNSAFQMLKKLHEKHPISILHSFWLGECAFVGNLFSKKHKIKHICTLMGQDVKKKNIYLKLLPLQNINLIFLSKFQEQLLLKNDSLQTTIIPWGVTKTRFLNSRQKTIDIIGVGSLIPLKNYELFIDVIFEINKTLPLKVVLIGDGKEKEKLQAKIKLLQLENTIALTGKLPYNETLEYISRAKVLLHTSHFESFGMVFPEALESKTIIVSKNVGSAHFNENWFICTTKEEMILACAKALTSTFSAQYHNPFIIENTVKNYLRLYNE